MKTKRSKKQNLRPDCAPPPGPPGSGRYGPKCSICHDLEPFHVHNNGKRIDDYFTIGRGMDDLTAARLWKQRAIEEGRLARLLTKVEDLFPDENQQSGGTYKFTLGKFMSGWVFSVVNDWYTWQAANLTWDFRFYPTPEAAVDAFLVYVEKNKIIVARLMR